MMATPPHAESISAPDDSVAPVDVGEIRSWDVTTDVLVVGLGCAGASAVIEARDAGAEVAVLERAGGPGGASALAGGEIYLGGGTPIQRDCGFEDTSEEMFRFLLAALGPEPDETKLRLYCEGSVEHFSWFQRLGVPFRASLWDQPAYIPPTDDGLMWLGENSHPFRDLARPAPRGHRPQAGHFGGRLLMDRLSEAVTARCTAATLVDAKVQRLVTGRDGSVLGVAATRYGQSLTVRARRGVVLATGGFVFNDSMLRDHAPWLLGHGKIGTEFDDGRGIRMAQAVGAAVRRMDAAQAAFWVSPALLAGGILVNRSGHRFVTEDTYPGLIGQATLFHQGGEAFLILDEEVFEQVPPELRMGQQPTWVAGSIAELEAEIPLPEGSLQATVDGYNRVAARGVDPLFHKSDRWLKALVPPFAAIDTRARGGANDGTGTGKAQGGFLVFTLGGLSTNEDGQVLDVDGDAIPGLFAVGRVSAGLASGGYISGVSLGDGTFFGRRAGRAAAAVRPAQ